jgi:signal recognition particle GTPase
MVKDFNANFKIEREIWEEFKSKYANVSERLRQLIKSDLNSVKEIPKVNRNNIETLKQLIFHDDNPIQIVGYVGVGKTTCMKRIIESDSKHIFIVLDAHDEYNLSEIQSITVDLKNSVRIKMPKQVSASRGLYPVYHNQILSQKWPENFVIVIEEAHRYPQVKELLKEARKFVKVIAICQEPIGNFCPIVEIVGD